MSASASKGVVVFELALCMTCGGSRSAVQSTHTVSDGVQFLCRVLHLEHIQARPQANK